MIGLGNVSKPKIKPPVILIYGAPGVGKSTLGAQFPNPLFLDLEGGLRSLEVDSVEIKSSQDFKDIVHELSTKQHDYKTVVVDTLDKLEGIITKEICTSKKVPTLGTLPYGRGFVELGAVMSCCVDDLINLREKGIIPLILSHEDSKPKDDPDVGSFAYRTIRISEYNAKYVRDSADLIIYFGPRMVVQDGHARVETLRSLNIGYSASHLSKCRIQHAPAFLDPNANAILELMSRPRVIQPEQPPKPVSTQKQSVDIVVP